MGGWPIKEVMKKSDNTNKDKRLKCNTMALLQQWQHAQVAATIGDQLSNAKIYEGSGGSKEVGGILLTPSNKHSWKNAWYSSLHTPQKQITECLMEQIGFNVHVTQLFVQEVIIPHFLFQT